MLKPAHIVTDTPEWYADTITRYAGEFASITTGPEAPVGAKYIFTGLAADANILAMVRVIRRLGEESVEFPFGTVSVCRHDPPKPDTPDPLPIVLPVPPIDGDRVRRLPYVSLIMCAYGQGAPRVMATREGLKQLLRLEPRPRIVFVELLWRGEESMYADLLGGHTHIIVHARDSNRVLFEKEACFKIGAEAAIADGASVLVFHDPDCYPDKPCWVGDIYNALDDEPETIFQAWSSYSDSEAVTHQSVQSYAYSKSLGQTNVLRAPGLSWAMTTERYQEVGGFNPFFAPGGGDAGWVFDVDESPVLSIAPFAWPWWLNIHNSRTVKAGKIGCVPAHMTHVNHGPFAERAYYWRNIAMTHLADDIRPALSLDDQWLVATTDTKIARELVYVLSRKAMMTDETSMLRLVAAAKEQE